MAIKRSISLYSYQQAFYMRELTLEQLIEEVCDIVGRHHHPRENETLNFKCLYDADLITNLEEQHRKSPITSDQLDKIIEKSFLTQSGRDLAKQTLSQYSG